MDSTSPLVIWLPPSVVNGFLDCRKPLNLSLSVVPPIVERRERSDRQDKKKKGRKDGKHSKNGKSKERSRQHYIE